MTNRTFLIAVMLFFLLPFCMGLGNAPEEQEEDIHVSEEVKIDREQEPEEQKKEKEDTKAAQEAASRKDGTDKREAEEETGKDTEAPAEDTAAEDKKEEMSAGEKELGELMLTEDEALFEDEERYYTRKGRLDPFKPFLREQEPEGEGEEEEGEELDRRKPQTPLEKIALSQLKLTAILRRPGENSAVAMVEDKNGKGYILRQGTYIGENGGQVADILRDRIIIREKYKDVFGKIAEREIEKKLQN